jgi:hydroxymethylbilane synthase
LFVKEIEQAMLDKEIDMAVHSMKDMPAILPEGLTIGCTPKRVDPRDVFISKNGVSFENLPEGATIGTSSLRRSAQLLAARPDLKMKWIRGNIDTRIRKLQEEDYDAIILAAAGLKRMGWEDDVITGYLQPQMCVPAVGQGALSIECRADDEELLSALQLLNDEVTEKTVAAERVFLHKMEGGCQVPIAGYATMTEHGQVELTALVGSKDGSILLKEVVVGENPEQVGEQAADLLIARGAKKLIEESKEQE